MLPGMGATSDIYFYLCNYMVSGGASSLSPSIGLKREAFKGLVPSTSRCDAASSCSRLLKNIECSWPSSLSSPHHLTWHVCGVLGGTPATTFLSLRLSLSASTFNLTSMAAFPLTSALHMYLRNIYCAECPSNQTGSYASPKIMLWGSLSQQQWI